MSTTIHLATGETLTTSGTQVAVAQSLADAPAGTLVAVPRATDDAPLHVNPMHVAALTPGA